MAEEGIEEECEPDSLLPHQRNLPSVEELKERIRFEPHYAIEGIMMDCANRISSIAKCSNGLKGGFVHDLRVGARKVQAGSLQLATIIKETGGSTGTVPQEFREKMDEMEKENSGLKKSVEELKEQIRAIRQMYSNDDFEDAKKFKKMEEEIKELRKKKEKMMEIIEELRKEKKAVENMENKVQRKKDKTIVIEEERRGRREEQLLQTPTLGPSRSTRMVAKARGPAEEFEDRGERVITLGRWEYVGGRNTGERGVEGWRNGIEVNNHGQAGSTPQRYRGEITRRGSGREELHAQGGRKNSAQDIGWGRVREERDRPPRRNQVEAVVIHKATSTESYADILRKVKNNINIEDLGISDTRIRRTATGGLLIQIAGEESRSQADALAEKVRGVVGEDARVGRPCRRAEIRVSGLDEDTTAEDVIEAVAKHGECDRQDVRVGNIRRNRQGEGGHLGEIPDAERCYGIK